MLPSGCSLFSFPHHSSPPPCLHLPLVLLAHCYSSFGVKVWYEIQGFRFFSPSLFFYSLSFCLSFISLTLLGGVWGGGIWQVGYLGQFWDVASTCPCPRRFLIWLTSCCNPISTHTHTHTVNSCYFIFHYRLKNLYTYDTTYPMKCGILPKSELLVSKKK